MKMKKKTKNTKIQSISLLLLLLTIPTVSLDEDHTTLKTFIVHISKSQKPSIFTTHQDWYKSTLSSLPPSPSSPHPTKLLYTYNHAVHGFSARLTAFQAAHLRHLPGVVSVIPEQINHIHTTHTPHFLGLDDHFGLWPDSNYGEDVIIGVLDTGIWPEIRSFNSTGSSPVPVPDRWKGTCETANNFHFCNDKIIGARAFYQGYEAHLGTTLDGESVSPRDTEGHGTHTASTAAGAVVDAAGFFQYAKGEARGMATKARIAAYKICWSLGCFDSDILAAFDQAVADGVDVISLSVGSSGLAAQYDHDSIAIGAFGAARKGVIVSCSAGNSGPGAFTAVNIAPWIITVGASTLDREFPADAVLGDGRVLSGVSLYSGTPLDDSDGLPLVYGGDCGDKYCYPGRLDAKKVSGKIVVCDRGGNARVEKGYSVKLAGGIGMILANTEESGEELIADSHLIAATSVGSIAGDKIRDYVRRNPSPTANILFKGTVIGSSSSSSTSAPKVAAFSSRGPNHLTPEILKPDIIAPGVNILAGWTGSTSPTDLEIDPRRVEFNIISGTSMSCPHISGLAALLRKAYPKWTTAAIKSALMTTAYNLDNAGKIFTDLATGQESTPFIHGAGHVDPNRALNPGLVYDIQIDDYLAFLCSIGYNSKRISVFYQSSFDCNTHGLASPGDLNYPSFSVVFQSNGDVVSYNRVVTNVGSSVDVVYNVTVKSPPSVEISVSPSELIFSPGNQNLAFVVTFKSNVEGETNSVQSEFGSIEWSDGVHVVRSPVAFRWGQSYSASI